MTEFVHLHNHSDFSLLDGASSIGSLIGKASSLGMKHVALTDHGNMFGSLKFYKACKEAGINPVIGCEFYVAGESRLTKTENSSNRYNHLILLAKSEKGYRNLIKLTSAGYTEGFYYKPRIDDELLEKYHEDLIALSACLAGRLPQLIIANQDQRLLAAADKYSQIFGKGNFYLELQDHGIPEQKKVNEALIRLSAATGLPLVATNDIHYTEKSDSSAQDILLCIGTNKKRNETARMKFHSNEFYMKSGEEMLRIFPTVPQALSNTIVIAEMCKTEITLPGPLLPNYTIPEGFTGPDHYLRHLSAQGLKKRYEIVTQELSHRLDYELNTIISMGFTGYFLIVWDFINYAKEHAIPVGPGRGSGAGSLVAYSLRITDIDPIRYNLLFERFLNPERVSMPDFDIDFCYERRQEVIDYVTQKYGKDRVGQIITFGTLKAKAVLKDVARVLDIPFAEANEISSVIPTDPSWRASLKTVINIEEMLAKESKKEYAKLTEQEKLKAAESNPKLKKAGLDDAGNLRRALEVKETLSSIAARGETYREMVDTGIVLEGLNRHASTHAAGIVIGKNDLTEYVPLYRDPKTGGISTQYTMDQLEECGLVKMDFLGLKTLTLIKHTVDLIKKRGIDFDIDHIDETDKSTFNLLSEGKSTCVFQFESSGMQNILKRAKPNKIEDLIALNALYRPGPMAYIDQFIGSKIGLQHIVYPLPELEEVLKETYGVIVYQEQVMEIARIVGGYSLGGADILRRAMGKKKAEVMVKEQEKFVKGAIEKGYKEQTAKDIFELLIPFAGYGFNKSHAAAYSILAYKTAFLKANYPAEFMAANLTNEISSPDNLTEYISEARKMGIRILPPNINFSDSAFSVVDGKIIYGLQGIKNTGAAAVEEILAARASGPFTSFQDFLERADLKTINKKVLESLIQAGVFDIFGIHRASLFNNLQKILDYVGSIKTSRLYGQSSLFESNQEEEFPPLKLDETEPWPESLYLEYEKQLLGFFVSGHPMDKYHDQWEKCISIDLSKPEQIVKDRTYNLFGMLKNLRVTMTKKGAKMAFAQLEDFQGSIELVLFPKFYEANESVLLNDAVIGILGKADIREDKLQIIAEGILNMEKMEKKSLSEVHIRLHRNCSSEDDLRTLCSQLIDHKGSCTIYLHTMDTHSSEIVIKAAGMITVNPDNNTLKTIRENPCVEEVWSL